MDSAPSCQGDTEAPDVLVDVPDDAPGYHDAYEWDVIRACEDADCDIERPHTHDWPMGLR